MAPGGRAVAALYERVKYMAKVVEEKQENTIDDIKSVIGDIKKINNLTKENMYEYGFTICKSDDGTVFTTPIIEGEEERIQREELYVSCPRGSGSVYKFGA